MERRRDDENGRESIVEERGGVAFEYGSAARGKHDNSTVYT